MSNLVDVGRLSAAYGIKGWVKVRSQTDPIGNLFLYEPWYVKTRYGVRPLVFEGWRAQGKGFVAKIKGIGNRNQAEALCPATIAIEKSSLPLLESGDYYWHQLQACRVVTLFDAEGGTAQARDLGQVERIIATGANDVLVVQGDGDSLDGSERLIPYVPGQFVRRVDVGNGVIYVDWDPAF